MSAKSNYNFQMPFLWLARKLTKTEDLRFVEEPLLSRPEVVISSADRARMESELKEAQDAELPPEDDF